MKSVLLTLLVMIGGAFLLFQWDHMENTQATPAPASNTHSNTQTLQQYGKMCADAIAEVPDFNCLDGDIIPVTVDGKTPQKYTPNMDCDRPALLPMEQQGQCIPYSRVLNFSKGNRQIVVGCRRKVIRNRNSVYFDEIDVISHNVGDGSTCWYQATAGTDPKGIDGSKVPSPDRPKPSPGYPDPATFWETPAKVASENCGGCHDNDPFMYSPYIGQVWNKVPTDPFGWYKHLGPDFAQWKTVSVSTPNNACVGCHRIGLEFTSGLGAQQTFDPATIKNADDWAKQYPHSHWMPPGNFHSQLQWQTIYQQSVEDLMACHNQPTLPNCIVEPIKSLH